MRYAGRRAKTHLPIAEICSAKRAPFYGWLSPQSIRLLLHPRRRRRLRRIGHRGTSRWATRVYSVRFGYGHLGVQTLTSVPRRYRPDPESRVADRRRRTGPHRTRGASRQVTTPAFDELPVGT